MTSLQIANDFLAKSHAITPPAGTVPIPRLITDQIAFFPVGSGFFSSTTTVDIFVIGQNFGNEAEYLQMQQGQFQDLDTPTWKNLQRLLLKHGIKPERCFFTNSFPHLFAGNHNTVGKFPASRQQAYVQACADFLQYQINTLKPKLLLTLGSYVPHVIGFLQGFDHYKNISTLKAIDQQNLSLTHANGLTVACLSHTSLYHSAVSGRRYREYSGEAAHDSLMADAVATLAAKEKSV